MKPSKAIVSAVVLAALVTFGIAIAATMSTPAGASGSGCGPCTGPTQSASATVIGSSCGGATATAARNAAILKAYQGAPSCVPCQLTNGPQACFAVDGIPPTNQYGVTWTVRYKCKACDLGPEFP